MVGTFFRCQRFVSGGIGSVSYTHLNGFLWGLLIVGPVLALLTFLILRKKKNLDISKYKEVLDESMKRLNSSPEYAKIVIKLQGVDSDSVYSMSLQQPVQP